MVDHNPVKQPAKVTTTQATGVLEPLQKRRHHRRSSRPRWLRKLRKQVSRFPLRRALIVALGTIAVLMVVGVALAADAQTRVTTSTNSLNRVLNTIRNKQGTELTLADFDRLRASVTDLNRTLNSARRQTLFLRPMTSLLEDAQVQLALLDAGQSLVLAGEDMLTGLEPTLFFLMGGSTSDAVVSQISSGERVVELLSLGRGRFLNAASHLERASGELAALDFNAVTPDVLLMLRQLEQTHEQLSAIQQLLLAAPDILTVALGLRDEQTYLVLAQNSDELRPSGGYLSSYGWIVMRNGRVSAYDYSATTTTSPTPPPQNIEFPFEIPDWWFTFRQPIYAAWDGSWSPDFRTTADMAMWYYNAGNNPHAPVTGAISIDIIGFQTLLGALGRIQVPGYNVTVDINNFRDVIYEIREGEGDNPHKEFLAALYKQIFEEWQSVDDVDTNSALLGALLQGLQEEHIMLRFADPALNQAVEQLGWSGSQGSGTESDYLMVVDANLGNKSNYSVIRQITYDAEVSASGDVNSRTTIAYDYPAALADNDPAVDPEHHGPIDYRTLLQVIAPDGAHGVTSTDPELTYRVVDQPEHTLITSLLTVPYDQAARLQYVYETPGVVEAFGPYQHYRLLIDKQSGTRGEAVSVQVSLPPGALPVSIDPAPAASYDIDRPILEFRLNSTRDLWVEVVYQLPQTSERVAIDGT